MRQVKISCDLCKAVINEPPVAYTFRSVHEAGGGASWTGEIRFSREYIGPADIDVCQACLINGYQQVYSKLGQEVVLKIKDTPTQPQQVSTIQRSIKLG